LGNPDDQEPLKKLSKTFESLELNKRIAAAKWLEGVIVSQVLSPDEKDRIIKASNEYTEALAEEEFEDKVNELVKYLKRVQKGSPRKKRGKVPAENPTPQTTCSDETGKPCPNVQL
jgi:hypothetical protein